MGGTPGAGGALATSSLLSGPDLGGGFLHQLSVEGQGEATSFTHHAQDGGADAGGPPMGPLDPLGFAHPPAACMFGGPRCWHRQFRLPLAQSLQVRGAYTRCRFTLEAMLSQVHAASPVEIPGALRELRERLATPLDREAIEWYVAGATAGSLQGGGFSPRDIALGTTRAGVRRIGELLAPYLIEPVAPTEWVGPGPVLAARAFVGTLVAGARVEWSVPLAETLAPRFAEFSGTPGTARLLVTRFEGHEIRTTRPEYGLLHAAERGRQEAEAAWLALVQRLGPDLELLDVLLERSPLVPARRASLRESVRGG